MNGDEINNLEQEENNPWEPPPYPEEVPVQENEPPEMLEAATLGNIFIEPGRTFEDLRRKPRFIMAGLLVLLFSMAYLMTLYTYVGFKEIATAKLETSSQVQQLDPEQKKAVIEQQTSPLVKYISLGVIPVVIIATFFIGGLIYWGGAMALGGSANYLHGVSVWVYSSLPPVILFTIVNLIVLFLKPIEDINLATSEQGVLQANPTFFMDVSEAPVLAAVLGSFDLFAIWSYILAIIGLKVVAKISLVSSSVIVLAMALLGMTIKVVIALLFG